MVVPYDVSSLAPGPFVCSTNTIESTISNLLEATGARLGAGRV